MLQDVLAKNPAAFATPPGGRIPAWRLRVPRADGGGCVHQRKLGHRAWPEFAGGRCGPDTAANPKGSGWVAEAVLRQWLRVFESGDGPVGVSERGEDGFLAARQADRQGAHRIVPRDVPRGVPERVLLHDTGRSQADHRGMAEGVQRESSSPGTGGEDAARVRLSNRRSLRSERPGNSPKLTLNLAQKTRTTHTWILSHSSGHKNPSQARSDLN